MTVSELMDRAGVPGLMQVAARSLIRGVCPQALNDPVHLRIDAERKQIVVFVGLDPVFCATFEEIEGYVNAPTEDGAGTDRPGIGAAGGPGLAGA